MDFETWDRERRARIRAFREVLQALEWCKTVADAEKYVTMFYDSEVIMSWPGGLKKSREQDDVSPAAIRRNANAPWDDKSGY